MKTRTISEDGYRLIEKKIQTMRESFPNLDDHLAMLRDLLFAHAVPGEAEPAYAQFLQERCISRMEALK